MGHLVKGLGHVVPAAVVSATEEAGRILARAEKEAAALRAAAQEEVEAARQAGFAAGKEAAMAEVSALLRAARARVEENLASSKDTAIVLARRMAEKIVGCAIELSPDLMNAIVAGALDVSRTRAGKVIVRVHPDDRVAIEAGRPRWTTRLAAAVDVHIQPDPAVDRGGCVVDTPSGRVDARLQTQLDALERALRDAAGAFP